MNISVKHSPPLRAALAVFLALSGAAALRAGPPFFTDDPEPVETGRWEFYTASSISRAKSGTSGTLPHFEANYGAFSGTQLHMIAPAAFNSAEGGPKTYGYGDTELGVKYRFIRETLRRPQFGTFVQVELPTGDKGRGLGGGRARLLLPLYFQKSWVPWTTYGGAGWWLNPGTGNRNWTFAGWLVQRDLGRALTLGTEVFRRTPDTDGGRPATGFNAGGQVNFNIRDHLLFSAGRDLSGPVRLSSYLAYQLTF